MPCHSVTRDADVDVVKATVERSRHCITTLVGEDTDLLILLLHYSRTDNEIIYFRTDANKQSKEHRVYNINLLKETLGDDVCNELLLYMPTQAVIKLQGFTASEKCIHPSK